MGLNPLDWFKPAADLVDSVGKAIDDNVTSDEERLKLRNELEALAGSFEVQMEELRIRYEEELTKRWVSDNENGSWMSRNIRPYTLIYITAIVSILAILDGNIGNFVIKPAWVSVFEYAFYLSLGGYFGLRTYEKHIGKVK